MGRKSLLSALILAAGGLGSKAFLNCLCADVKINGLSRLLDELERARIQKRKGIMTVSNHISVLDDPLTWGILPTSHYIYARPTRWSLGASDICFTNPLFSAFFRQGQVLETIRGGGIRQEAVDRSISLLNEGEWVHVFPEGKIAQPPHSNMGRLKWGIGRMLMEVDDLPTIIPMWLTGFDKTMDENRSFPRFLPRLGKRISVTFSPSDVLQKRIQTLRDRFHQNTEHNLDAEAKMRSAITQVVQEELESLGDRVSGEVREGLKEGKEKT